MPAAPQALPRVADILTRILPTATQSAQERHELLLIEQHGAVSEPRA